MERGGPDLQGGRCPWILDRQWSQYCQDLPRMHTILAFMNSPDDSAGIGYQILVL
jgi:hypothetical protein